MLKMNQEEDMGIQLKPDVDDCLNLFFLLTG